MKTSILAALVVVGAAATARADDPSPGAPGAPTATIVPADVLDYGDGQIQINPNCYNVHITWGGAPLLDYTSSEGVTYQGVYSLDADWGGGWISSPATFWDARTPVYDWYVDVKELALKGGRTWQLKVWATRADAAPGPSSQGAVWAPAPLGGVSSVTGTAVFGKVQLTWQAPGGRAADAGPAPPDPPRRLAGPPGSTPPSGRGRRGRRAGSVRPPRRAVRSAARQAPVPRSAGYP